jgi:transketolase
VLYDDNLITIDGETELSFSENVLQRYESYGWHTQTVSDVTDLNELREAIYNAKAETDRPSMIKVICHTVYKYYLTLLFYLGSYNHWSWKCQPRN